MGQEDVAVVPDVHEMVRGQRVAGNRCFGVGFVHADIRQRASIRFE